MTSSWSVLPGRPALPRVADTPAEAAVLVDVTTMRSWSTEALGARADTAGALVWLDRDEITFVYCGTAGSVRLCCGIQLDMYQVAGGDVWALTVQQAELLRAVVSYTFFMVIFNPRVAGHDATMWKEEFATAALWAFGIKGNSQ